MKNKRLIPETPIWNNRPPVLRVPEKKVEKRYRNRSLYQSDLFLVMVGITFLLAFIAPAVSAANVSHDLPSGQDLTVNRTYTLNTSGSTPAILWVGAIVLGVLLLITSFIPFPNGEEGLLSIAAWLPLGYAMYTSMAVDIVTNAGTVVSTSGIAQVESHTIYQFSTEGMILLIVLAAAVGNTYRIWIEQKKVRELTGGSAPLEEY